MKQNAGVSLRLLLISFSLLACSKEAKELTPIESADSVNLNQSAATASPSKIPQIAHGTEYALARKQIRLMGWEPQKIAGQTLDGEFFVGADYPEHDSCAGTGLAPCVMIFKDASGNILRVYTEGEVPFYSSLEIYNGTTGELQWKTNIPEASPETELTQSTPSQRATDPLSIRVEVEQKRGWSPEYKLEIQSNIEISNKKIKNVNYSNLQI